MVYLSFRERPIRTRELAFVLAAACSFSSCSYGTPECRSAKPGSQESYLLVDSRPPQGCQKVLVDNRDWTENLFKQIPVSPGAHTLACGGSEKVYEIVVEPRTVCYIDFWR